MFTRSPEELAYSRTHLVVALAMVLLAQWLAKEQSTPEAGWYHWAGIVVLLQLIRMAPFILFKKNERVVQSLTALLGADFIISFPLLIALFVIDATQKSVILNSLFLFSFNWQFLVSVYVYKLSLEFSWIKSVVLVLAMYVSHVFCVIAIARIFGSE